MEQLIWMATMVGQVLIVCGGIMFLLCFITGAYMLWQMFSISVYSFRLIYKWNRYKKIPIEGREEANKSGYFNDDTKDIK